MMVTKRSVASHDWAKKRCNAQYDFSLVNGTPIAVLGAVSREKGIDLMMTFPKSINVTKFKVFLDELRRINPFDNILIMMDNLAVHRNKSVRERMDELGFRYAWTPRYSPQYNGIEEVWSLSKRYIKKERLNAI